MFTLAGAAPVPFVIKIFVAFLFLGLCSFLARKRYGRPLSVISVVVSILLCAVSVICIEVGNVDSLGVISAIAGLSIATLFLRPERQSSVDETGSTQQTSRNHTHPLILGLITFLYGPILGCVFALIYWSAIEINPNSDIFAFQDIILFVSILGFFGALMVTFLCWHKPNESPSESNHK